MHARGRVRALTLLLLLTLPGVLVGASRTAARSEDPPEPGEEGRRFRCPHPPARGDAR